jgi:hypothetical protein
MVLSTCASPCLLFDCMTLVAIYFDLLPLGKSLVLLQSVRHTDTFLLFVGKKKMLRATTEM